MNEAGDGGYSPAVEEISEKGPEGAKEKEAPRSHVEGVLADIQARLGVTDGLIEPQDARLPKIQAMPALLELIDAEKEDI